MDVICSTAQDQGEQVCATYRPLTSKTWNRSLPVYIPLTAGMACRVEAHLFTKTSAVGREKRWTKFVKRLNKMRPAKGCDLALPEFEPGTIPERHGTTPWLYRSFDSFPSRTAICTPRSLCQQKYHFTAVTTDPSALVVGTAPSSDKNSVFDLQVALEEVSVSEYASLQGIDYKGLWSALASAEADPDAALIALSTEESLELLGPKVSRKAELLQQALRWLGRVRAQKDFIRLRDLPVLLDAANIVRLPPGSTLDRLPSLGEGDTSHVVIAVFCRTVDDLRMLARLIDRDAPRPDICPSQDLKTPQDYGLSLSHSPISCATSNAMHEALTLKMRGWAPSWDNRVLVLRERLNRLLPGIELTSLPEQDAFCFSVGSNVILDPDCSSKIGDKRSLLSKFVCEEGVLQVFLSLRRTGESATGDAQFADISVRVVELGFSLAGRLGFAIRSRIADDGGSACTASGASAELASYLAGEVIASSRLALAREQSAAASALGYSAALLRAQGEPDTALETCLDLARPHLTAIDDSSRQEPRDAEDAKFERLADAISCLEKY